MASNSQVKNLLKKKGWTGEAVGKALISLLIYDYRKNRDPDAEQPLTLSDFNRLRDSLYSAGNNYEIAIFRRYKSAYSGLVDSFNMWQTHNQQLNHAYYRILMYLLGAYNAEEDRLKRRDYPIIISEEKYNELRAKAEETYRAEPVSYSFLVFTAMNRFNGDYPKELSDILDAYKEKELEDPAFIDWILEDYGLYYYYFNDGTNADDLSDEEVNDKIRDHFSNDFLKKFLDLKKKPIPAEVFYKMVRAYTDQRDENGEKPLKGKYKEALEFIDTAEYKTYEDFKKNNKPITYYDFIAGSYAGLLERFYAFDDEEETLTANYLRFKKAFPELAEYLEGIVNSYGVPAFKGIKPDQYGADLTTWGELADLGVYDIDIGDEDIACEINTGDETLDKEYYYRAFANGFSIYRPDEKQSPLKAKKIDEYGMYKNEDNSITFIQSVEHLYNDENARSILNDCYNELLSSSLKFYYYYKATLETLAQMLEMPDLIELVPIKDMETTERQLLNLKNLTVTLTKSVIRSRWLYCESVEKRDESIDMVTALFPLINLEDYNPTAEAMEALKEELGADNAIPLLTDLSQYINTVIKKDDELKAERGLLNE